MHREEETAKKRHKKNGLDCDHPSQTHLRPKRRLTRGTRRLWTMSELDIVHPIRGFTQSSQILRHCLHLEGLKAPQGGARVERCAQILKSNLSFPVSSGLQSVVSKIEVPGPLGPLGPCIAVSLCRSVRTPPLHSIHKNLFPRRNTSCKTRCLAVAFFTRKTLCYSTYKTLSLWLKPFSCVVTMSLGRTRFTHGFAEPFVPGLLVVTV